MFKWQFKLLLFSSTLLTNWSSQGLVVALLIFATSPACIELIHGHPHPEIFEPIDLIDFKLKAY
jgi:hypothetical protein